MPIYISTAHLTPRLPLSTTVTTLAEAGFRHIELSGGECPDRDYLDTLLKLQDKYGLHYLCHNYFPPPAVPITLNLASLDTNCFEQSLNQFIQALSVSRALCADRFALHAGFFLDVRPEELGHAFTHSVLNNKIDGIEQFCRGFTILSERANGIELYIENNVVSRTNRETFVDDNPFMLTCSEEYRALRKRLPFKLLLDIGHLHVSAHSLGIAFSEELNTLLDQTDYIHLSDNDGTTDRHLPLTPESAIYRALAKHDISDKLLTLEIAGTIGEIRKTFDLMNKTFF